MGDIVVIGWRRECTLLLYILAHHHHHHPSRFNLGHTCMDEVYRLGWMGGCWVGGCIDRHAQFSLGLPLSLMCTYLKTVHEIEGNFFLCFSAQHCWETKCSLLLGACCAAHQKTRSMRFRRSLFEY